MESVVGQMRCLQALGEWEDVEKLAEETWKAAEEPLKYTIAPFAAAASWNMGHYDQMSKFVEMIDGKTVEGAFYRSILAIHNDQFR